MQEIKHDFGNNAVFSDFPIGELHKKTTAKMPHSLKLKLGKIRHYSPCIRLLQEMYKTGALIYLDNCTIFKLDLEFWEKCRKVTYGGGRNFLKFRLIYHITKKINYIKVKIENKFHRTLPYPVYGKIYRKGE